jgi:hypothetical protein
MRVRVEEDLRSAFVKACHRQDLTAAQVIRAFMRDFVERVEAADQQDFLDILIQRNTANAEF